MGEQGDGGDVLVAVGGEQSVDVAVVVQPVLQNRRGRGVQHRDVVGADVGLPDEHRLGDLRAVDVVVVVVAASTAGPAALEEHGGGGRPAGAAGEEDRSGRAFELVEQARVGGADVRRGHRRGHGEQPAEVLGLPLVLDLDDRRGHGPVGDEQDALAALEHRLVAVAEEAAAGQRGGRQRHGEGEGQEEGAGPGHVSSDEGCPRPTLRLPRRATAGRIGRPGHRPTRFLFLRPPRLVGPSGQRRET